MATEDPSLTIGLPVYNGEQYIRQAVDSILGQTFTNFELIISDNASTDGTAEICKDYARRDARVRYCRHGENIGAAENFNSVFRVARGRYFKWAAHDDVLDSHFLEKCMEVLEADPSIILSYSKVIKIDPTGNQVGSYDYDMRVSNPRRHVRFSDLILVNHFCVAIFGIIHRDVLEKTPLIAKFVGSDRTLLAELGLRGRLHEVPEYLFHRRDHPQASTSKYRHRNRLSWFDPKQRQKIVLPYWRNGFEHLSAVTRVPMPLAEKLRCYGVALSWFWFRRKVLFEDIKGAVLQILPFIQSTKKEVKTSLRENEIRSRQ